MNKKVIKLISIITLVTILAYSLPVMAYTKEEIVYVKQNTDGKTYKTIVSSHIKNTEAKQTIKDLSDLLNIENTNRIRNFSKGWRYLNLGCRWK